MAPPPILYREGRITPIPSSPSSVLHIDTSAGQQRASLLRAGSKRTFDDISGLDEESYARKHLATEGSVFFRSKARSPRSFLWRILDNRKVLEVQAVDLVKESRWEGTDSWLTYHVSFNESILQNGVAFADPEETDALECFVVTESRELYTVTLKRDLLTRARAPTEFDASTCVKKYTSSFLSVRHPYRFVAVSSLELLVSLAEGGLVRLERKASENGSQWRETFFSEGGWSGTLTLKRINPFAHHQTVHHGNLELDTTAIADMAKSPDGKYVWTVSLDHWLRAWSTKTGKIAAKMDILNRNEENQRRSQSYVMSPEQGILLQIVRPPSSRDSRAVARMEEDDKYYIVIHSPKDHQFKMYDIRHTFTSVEGEGIHIDDLQSRNRLIPPVDELMNTNIWHLEQFHMHLGYETAGTQLWIRARSGALCKNFMLTFDVLDEDGSAMEVQGLWQTGWSVVDAGPLTSEELRHCAGYPGDLEVTADSTVTPSDRWLGFLFYPSRFSIASMETALHIYRKGRGLPANSSRGIKAAEQPLEERLTTAITSKVLLRRLPNEQADYDRYQQDIQAQWQTFYSLLSHLHNRRHETVGLAFDAEDALPWSICADYVAPIRACSGLELRIMNTHLLPNEAAQRVDQVLLHRRIYPEYLHREDEHLNESVYLSRLMAAARELRRGLSATAQEKVRAGAAADALLEGGPDSGRAQAVFEHCGLEAEVTDEDFDTLSLGVESLGGLGSLTDDMVLGLLDWIDAEGEEAGRDSGMLLNRHGAVVTVEIAQETLQHVQDILLDVIALVVFMAGGLEADELAEEFDADKMYAAALNRLRRVQLFLWLVSHAREKTVVIAASRPSERDTEITSEVTLLENLFIPDWTSLDSKVEETTMPALLSIWSKGWLKGIDTSGGHWSGVTAHVLAFLLTHKEHDLAVDFLRFTTDATAWSVYLKARLRVAIGDYAQASLMFRSAAEGCAALRNIDRADTAQLLSVEEWNYFGNGLAMYFQHVAAIFEKLRIYSYVADFATLALQNTERVPDFARSIAAVDRKKRQQNSPIPDKLAAAEEETRLLRLKDARDEIVNRLFTALMQTGHFLEAYDALVQIETRPMKNSGLKKLIESCAKQDAVPTLLDLPFRGELALEADKVLLEMAKKGMETGASAVTTPPYQILYAFRTQRSDFRGAAEVLYEHLERLRRSPHNHAVQDPDDETLVQAYVLLINTLACCGEEDAWLLADPIGGVHKEGRKRRLVTLADLRREYTAELDKRSDMLHGRFALVGGGDEMDVL